MWNLGMVQWVIPNNHRKRDAERLFLSLRVWVLFCNKKKTHVQKRDWFQFAIPTSVSQPFSGPGSTRPSQTPHLPNLCGIGGLNLLLVPLWFLSSSTLVFFQVHLWWESEVGEIWNTIVMWNCETVSWQLIIHSFIHPSIHPSFLPSFLPSLQGALLGAGSVWPNRSHRTRYAVTERHVVLLGCTRS